MEQESPAKKERQQIKGPGRYLFIIAGAISFCLGSAGLALPILPTTPFYLLTVFCFARSSKRMHEWFVNTRLHQKYLERFVRKRAMTWKAKLSILSTVTLVMGLSFILMCSAAGRIILAVVWFAHVLYFLFRAKTVR